MRRAGCLDRGKLVGVETVEQVERQGGAPAETIAAVARAPERVEVLVEAGDLGGLTFPAARIP